MKIYKFWEIKNKENFAYVAAGNFRAAMRYFQKANDLIQNDIKGETLLNKNPSSSADYLELDVEPGILDQEINYFKGDKKKIKSVEPAMRHFIRQEIKKEVEKYFERQVPEFNAQ
jgi:hypothetical protein